VARTFVEVTLAAPREPRNRAKTTTKNGREAVLRLVAAAFALTLASSAQALPPVVSLNQPDKLVLPVRQAGGGMHLVNGKCVRRTPAVPPGGAPAE
jgi:hypothetical protein